MHHFCHKARIPQSMLLLLQRRLMGEVDERVALAFERVDPECVGVGCSELPQDKHCTCLSVPELLTRREPVHSQVVEKSWELPYVGRSDFCTLAAALGPAPSHAMECAHEFATLQIVRTDANKVIELLSIGVHRNDFYIQIITNLTNTNKNFLKLFENNLTKQKQLRSKIQKEFPFQKNLMLYSQKLKN